MTMRFPVSGTPLYRIGEVCYRFRTTAARSIQAVPVTITSNRRLPAAGAHHPALTSPQPGDGLFRRDLAMRITEAPDGLAARFDFVLDMR